VTVIRLSLGKAPRSALLLDDSALLGVLSTPIRTQWKGLPARRNLCIPRTLKLSLPCQPVVCSKIKFHYLTLPAADTGLVDLGTFRSTDVESTSPPLPEGSFRSTVVETLTSGPEARRRLADHVAAVHRLKAARSVIHRFRLKRHIPGRRPHTA
jgi:hypothetical protein